MSTILSMVLAHRPCAVSRAPDAGFGSGQRDRNGLEIAHLPDQNDIGGLTHGRTQSGGIRQGVGSDLTLVDDAGVVAVEIFDRIFERQHMAGAFTVDLVDDRGQCPWSCRNRWDRSRVPVRD
jgi:hypothetical protein